MEANTAPSAQFKPAEAAELTAPAAENPTFNLSFTSQSFNDTKRYTWLPQD